MRHLNEYRIGRRPINCLGRTGWSRIVKRYFKMGKMLGLVLEFERAPEVDLEFKRSPSWSDVGEVDSLYFWNGGSFWSHTDARFLGKAMGMNLPRMTHPGAKAQRTVTQVLCSGKCLRLPILHAARVGARYKEDSFHFYPHLLTST